MNAPESIFNQLAPATLHALALICTDGKANLQPGMIFLPVEAGQRSLDAYWRSYCPPKPPEPPRLLAAEVSTANTLTLPSRVVAGDAVRGAELLAFIADAYAPPLVWVSPDEVTRLTASGSTGKLKDSELLRRCFAHLSARGLDALEVPAPGLRGVTGIVPLSFQQVRLTGEALGIVRDFDNCFGFSWQKSEISHGELQKLTARLQQLS